MVATERKTGRFSAFVGKIAGEGRGIENGEWRMEKGKGNPPAADRLQERGRSQMEFENEPRCGQETLRSQMEFGNEPARP